MLQTSAERTAMNGRLPSGQFGAGNTAAVGRTNRAAELRQAFVDAVTPEDIAGIAATLVRLAKDGDVACAKLVLDRLGKSVDVVATDQDSIGEVLLRARIQRGLAELRKNDPAATTST